MEREKRLIYFEYLYKKIAHKKITEIEQGLIEYIKKQVKTDIAFENRDNIEIYKILLNENFPIDIEYLIEFLQNDGNNCVFMGVGGSFDVISGNISRAPKWIQKMNLEWLYRVVQEPKRLFKRYFIGNLVFIKAIMKEKKEKK